MSTELSSKKKVAIIGYGGQGAWHAKKILESDVSELVGIYDIKKERMTAAERDGIYTYPSVEALLSDARVEIVIVATPNDEHKRLVISALESGKNVICEKPVEMSVSALDEMCDAAEKAGKLFSVHQNRRFDVDFLAIKGIIESGEIGDVISVESRVHGSRGIPSDWRCEREHGGGMILDWGVHLIDQMLLLIPSRITRIFCHTSHITNQEVDDGFKLELYFEDGKSAHIEVGTYNFIHLPRFYMQCKSGSALITDWTQKTRVAKLKAWCEKDVTPVQTAAGITKTMAPRDHLTLDEYEVERPTSDVHDYVRNFCASIDGREELLVTLSQVRRVMRVMEAAFESSERGEAIEVNI